MIAIVGNLMVEFAGARMQFEEMSPYEREEIRKALLKYCELDTMAMIMIYEHFLELVA